MGRTAVGQIRRRGVFTRVDIAFATSKAVEVDTMYNAFPHMILLPDGSLLRTWRRAATHFTSGDFGSCVVKQSAVSDWTTWSARSDIAVGSSPHDYRDSCLTLLPDGSIAHVTWYRTPPSSPPVGTGLELRIAPASTPTVFGSPTVVTSHGFTQWAATAGPIVVLADGTWLWPIYGQDTGNSYRDCKILASIDQGATWTVRSYLVLGAQNGVSLNEPNIVLLSDGRLVGLARTALNGGPTVPDHTYRRISTDNGFTWGPIGYCFDAWASPHAVTFPGDVLALVSRNSVTDRTCGYVCRNIDANVWSAPVEVAPSVLGASMYGAIVPTPASGPGQFVIAYSYETTHADQRIVSGGIT